MTWQVQNTVRPRPPKSPDPRERAEYCNLIRSHILNRGENALARRFNPDSMKFRELIRGDKVVKHRCPRCNFLLRRGQIHTDQENDNSAQDNADAVRAASDSQKFQWTNSGNTPEEHGGEGRVQKNRAKQIHERNLGATT